MNEDEWGADQEETVRKTDNLFGNKSWRSFILNGKSENEREQDLTMFYRNRLMKWFRYVLPLPFKPKTSQLYHVFVCSNYESGVNAVRGYYSKETGNKSFMSERSHALENFVKIYPNPNGSGEEPLGFKFLWRIMKYHEGGVCDQECWDLREIAEDYETRQSTLNWLLAKGYLKTIDFGERPWEPYWLRYELDWSQVEGKLDVHRPPELTPLLPESTLLPFFRGDD